MNLESVDDALYVDGGYEAIYNRHLSLDEDEFTAHSDDLEYGKFAAQFRSRVINYSWHRGLSFLFPFPLG